jgi:DNA-binding transcriptional regulator YdaS (Cro superfamily)
MRGAELCDVLKESAGVASDTALAAAIGVTPARVAQFRKQSTQLTKKYSAKLITKILDGQGIARLDEAVRPFVEFFPVELSQVRVDGKYIPYDCKIYPL